MVIAGKWIYGGFPNLERTADKRGLARTIVFCSEMPLATSER
jgi:hypothetical protein